MVFPVDPLPPKKKKDYAEVTGCLHQFIHVLNWKFYIADLSNSEPVMFYATTRDQDHSIPLEKKSILVFERVVMNIGGHYNNIDGIFVAPKTGIYLFAWTVCTSGANYAMTELMVDNTMISRAGEKEASGNFDCGSMTAVCRMDKDKHAWIRTTEYGSKNWFRTYKEGPQSSFMAIMVHGKWIRQRKTIADWRKI